METEPQRFRHAIGGLAEPGKTDLDGRFSVRQGRFQVHLLRPRDPAGSFRLGIIDPELREDAVAEPVRPCAALHQER